MSFNLPNDPYQLAEKRAEQSTSNSWDALPEDYKLLEELDFVAEELGFVDTEYFIDANRGFVIPREFDPKDTVTYVNCMDVLFEGKFTGFSKVHIGRIIGVGAVRAVCLTFKEATILPFFEKIEDTEFLHVPVLAVQSIENV